MGVCFSLLLWVIGVSPVWAEGTTTSYEARVLLIPKREAILSSELSERVLTIPFHEGALFRKGDILVGLDCRLHKARLKEAAALLDGAEKMLSNKKALAALQSTGELEVALAKIEHDKAKARAAITEIQVKRCTIVAPFAGRVVESYVKQYESVAVGTKLLAILDDSQLRLELVVPSRWLIWLHKGTTFSLSVDETATKHQCTVTALGARIDPVSQSVKVYAELDDNGDGLMAGMSGTASFVSVGGQQ